MNNSTSGDHEAPTSSADKGLKMKIKRTKTVSGPKIEGNNTSSTTGSSKHEVVKGGGSGFTSGSIGASSSSQENSNSSSTSNTSLNTAVPSANKMANHSPFEKLRQAILEQQEKSKQAKQKSDSSKDHKGKGTEGNTGSREGASGLSNMFRGSGNHSEGGSGLHSVKHQKNDPYEFNAKNEDRLGGGGLPSKKLKIEKPEKSEMRDVTTDTSSVSVMTDPDCLGPCEPGTSVVLEGIVWQETENGLLVVNVTWRGKTYVGTLLDATKHEWAPPSFRSDSPQDPDARTPRGGRGKRGRTTMNSMGARGTRNTRNSSSTGQSCNPPPSPAKSNSAALPVIGEKRKPEGTSAADVASPAKKQKFEIGETPLRQNVLQETWFVCSHPECSKRYREMNALKYHQNNAHKDLLLQQEQGSEHNKTHVRFAGMQQNSAAQTDEKPNKEKRNKKKKSKKNRPEQQQENQQQQMEVDQPNNIENVNSGAPIVKTEPCDIPQQSNQAAASNVKNSPETASLKQARIQLSQVGVPNTNSTSPTSVSGQRTVTAPIVAVPVGSQSPPSNGSAKMEGGLSKEEKKKEKKKKKKEKKEKKLLEQQQQQQQKDVSGNIPQQQKPTDINNSVNKSPNSNSVRTVVSSAGQVTVPPHSTHTMSGSLQQQQNRPANSDNNKQSPVKDNVNMTESVHSPAYSDISDEGNDNVPVLENEVELAKKSQQQVVQPKESSGESIPKGLQQEPPNLTPVITHTGHPSGPMQPQVFPSKDMGVRPSNLTLRNAGPQQPPNSSELNMQNESFGSSGRENVKPPQGNETHQARPNMAPQPQQKHNKYGSFPQGYNFNQSPSGNTKLNQMGPNQDKLNAQKQVEDKSRNSNVSIKPESVNQGHSPNGPSKMQQPPGVTERPGDMARRSVDSNMNMPPKMLVGPQNSQQIGPKLNMPPNTTEMSKQVSQLNKSEVPKTNSVEQHFKQSPGGMSISERQSENVKILKENIDIKRQMNEKDKQAETSINQREKHDFLKRQMMMMQQQQHHQQQQLIHQRYLTEQARGKGGPPPPGSEPRESPKPPHNLHSSHPSAPNHGLARKENSPMASPKTKAELKQGIERNERKELQTAHHPGHRPDHHRGDMSRDHRLDILRDHRPDFPREQRPDMLRDHRPDMNREHRPDMNREHRPDMHREHRPDMIRDHHRMDIPREHRMDPSREPLRIDLSREPRPEHRQERDHRLDTSRDSNRDHRSLERHPSDRHLDNRSGDPMKRPPSTHPDKPDSRKDPPKSPAPAPSMSSPSMSSPVPPQASVPHNFPYGYPPGYPHMYPPGMQHFMAAYPGQFMSPYGVPPQDGKALEMLQLHAQYYNRDQMKAQDLRKMPDRKSPNPDGERPSSRNHQHHSEYKRGDSPGLSRSAHVPVSHAGAWLMHNGGPVPMMQPSPQSSSAKH